MKLGNEHSSNELLPNLKWSSELNEWFEFVTK